MFGNLVHIELIRLFRSRILKFSIPVGILILLMLTLFCEFAVQMNGIEGVIPAPVFRISYYTVEYSFVMSMIAPVNVIVTTCGYNKYRLAVNIEGAVRNRLKLIISEITGIVIFVFAINLIVVPALFLVSLIDNTEISLISSGNGVVGLLETYLGISLSVLFSCLIVYLVSKFTSHVYLASVLSLLLAAFGLGATVFIGNELEKNSSMLNIIDDSIGTILLAQFIIVPIVFLSILLAIKYRKADRI